MAEDLQSLEYTATWVVAAVSFIMIFISFGFERSLHYLGKFLRRKQQDALYEALQKLKEELMLLGFISLLLTVFQGLISQICVPEHLTTHMLPCKREDKERSSEHETLSNATFTPPNSWNGRRLLSEGNNTDYCSQKGKVPLLSLEGLHQLHIFIFVLAVVYMVCIVSTLILGRVKVRQWARWENSIRRDLSESGAAAKVKHDHAHHHLKFFRLCAAGYWRKSIAMSWIRILHPSNSFRSATVIPYFDNILGQRAFFNQFYGNVTKSEYITMRLEFIMTHTPIHRDYDFNKYMMRTLAADFKKIVGIRWYLWLFVVFFLLLNVQGWHAYFWLSFLPLALLLAVGTKLEHIIAKLAEEVAERDRANPGAGPVMLSDDRFWFGKPALILYLIDFILFQNAFQIAFFFWIMSTYGFTSCIMDKQVYIIPRLLISVIIQVLCNYSTLPLYTIVTQMGSMFKEELFDQHITSLVKQWMEDAKNKRNQELVSQQELP